MAATLARLAFADRQIQGWREEWKRQGVGDSAALQVWNRAAMERLRGQNAERLDADPRSTVQDVIAAAESIDAKASSGNNLSSCEHCVAAQGRIR